MNSKIRRNKRNTKTNKRKTNKRTDKKTNKRRTYHTRKQYRKKHIKHIKQYGGKFNNEQTQQILKAIEDHQDTEPFTQDEVNEYVGKLHDISQVHARHFDIFYENMIQCLEGEGGQTFKEWIDMVHDEHKEMVETDNEIDTDEEF
jgi:uncharacterized Rmd1/YagE family protein